MKHNQNLIVIAGGSGFLGGLLGRWSGKRGFEVVVLSREPAPLPWARTVAWDGETLGDWAAELDGARALINLAGRSVNCRYHAKTRRRIMDSRVLSTRVLGQAVAATASPPPVWLQSSTATIYLHTYGAGHGESGSVGDHPEAKDKFSIEVARAWEQAIAEAVVPGVRKVMMRTAIVMDREPGTAYGVLRNLVRCGLGGAMGHGRQFFSWIHAEDFCRAVAWLIDRDDAEGIYNIAAPNPLPNREVMAILRQAHGRPFGLPASRAMLEIGAFFLRTETELIIKSRRVVPERLLNEGFVFHYSQMEQAIEALCAP